MKLVRAVLVSRAAEQIATLYSSSLTHRNRRNDEKISLALGAVSVSLVRRRS